MPFQLRLAPPQTAQFFFDHTPGFVRRRFPNLYTEVLGTLALVHLRQKVFAEFLAAQAPAAEQLLQVLQLFRSAPQFESFLKFRTPRRAVFLYPGVRPAADRFAANRGGSRDL